MRPLPYTNGGQLVILQQKAGQANAVNIAFSPKETFDYRDRSCATAAAARRVHELIVFPDDVHESLLHSRWMYTLGPMDTFPPRFLEESSALISTRQLSIPNLTC